MSKVVLAVSMSLDGFTAGPNVREEDPLGDGGERVHAWMARKGQMARSTSAYAKKLASCRVYSMLTPDRKLTAKATEVATRRTEP
jgi:hypothetical protein